MNRRNFLKKSGLVASVVAISGYTVMGKSIIPKSLSVLEKMNTRLIINKIKEDMELLSRQFVFCKNDIETRTSWNRGVDEMLNKYKSVGIISKYSSVCDEIDHNLIHGTVSIKINKSSDWFFSDWILLDYTVGSTEDVDKYNKIQKV